MISAGDLSRQYGSWTGPMFFKFLVETVWHSDGIPEIFFFFFFFFFWKCLVRKQNQQTTKVHAKLPSTSKEFTHFLLGNFACFLSSAEKFLQGQTVWIQIKVDVLSDLIWIQTVCNAYQQTTLVDRVNMFSALKRVLSVCVCSAQLSGPTINL